MAKKFLDKNCKRFANEKKYGYNVVLYIAGGLNAGISQRKELSGILRKRASWYEAGFRAGIPAAL